MYSTIQTQLDTRVRTSRLIPVRDSSYFVFCTHPVNRGTTWHFRDTRARVRVTIATSHFRDTTSHSRDTMQLLSCKRTLNCYLKEGVAYNRIYRYMYMQAQYEIRLVMNRLVLQRLNSVIVLCTCFKLFITFIRPQNDYKNWLS